ncbi:MAG: hypothetical protein ABEH65_07340 [Halobacteriales archaeon]
MERFAWFVTVGGLLLVAGLWIIELPATTPRLQLVGVAISVAGMIGLLYGIAIELEPIG